MVQPQGLAEPAAAGDGQREKYKLLPLEVWMAIFVRYETAAVTGGDVGGGKAHVLYLKFVSVIYSRREGYIFLIE